MPAEAVHLTALRESLAAPRVSPAARRIAARHDDAARLGAVIIDFPYFDRFPEQVARYAFGIAPRHSPWGLALHARGPIEALAAVLAGARARRDEEAAAFALGVASHCSLDRDIHPLVNALARANGVRRGKTLMSAHMEVEKFQSILFHEELNGCDFMGTPAVTRYVDLGLAPRLRAHPLGAAWRGALASEFGEGPERAALSGWGRGYRDFSRLIGSPVGATIAPPRAKEAARPVFYESGFGRFPDIVARSIARSIPILDAVADVYEASEPDAPAAFARLSALLPPGTIDGAGEGIDLGVPYR